jgi:glycogen debranching enzyme
MQDVIEVEDRFYILAESQLAEGRTLTLKHGETFGVFNVLGDVEVVGHHEAQGVFCNGMRHLSRLQTRINGMRPLVLSSRVTTDNTRLIVDLTNPDMAEPGRMKLNRGTLHMLRSRSIWNDACFERITVTNFALHAVDVTISIAFEADFTDIFEVRGTEREKHGTRRDPEIEHGDNCGVVLAYDGLDGVERRTRVDCRPAPDGLSESELHFHMTLAPHERKRLHVTFRFEPSGEVPSAQYDENRRRIRESVREFHQASCMIDSSHEQLTAWLERSYADVRMLMTHTEEGPYPYAGVPWFSCPFGRDGIITALEMVWVKPSLARGVLAYLARTQAGEDDPARDAEPGKILHERRTNEMAATGEVPFGRYYGSVDSTPLFVALAGAYHRTTGDTPFLERIWPNIERALRWIDEFGDHDGDGFVEYKARTREGLVNQGWKDSHDSIFHADGDTPPGPIALCEVQGYVHQARLEAAAMARALGDHDGAQRLERQAAELRRRFNETFWIDELGMYALALDGEKRPCRVRTSNAGHCLYSGIADRERAQIICGQLMGRDMFSGWGGRTLARGEARYNPMSYHNGSIWPHDNAIIAAGLSQYGFQDETLRLFEAWLDAAIHLELHRLPELFCGFRRRQGKGPTAYPVACNPQAWASGAVFMLLGACLGLSVDGQAKRVYVNRPRLPRSVGEVRMQGLRAGDGSIDVTFRRERTDVGVIVRRKRRGVDVVVLK